MSFIPNMTEFVRESNAIEGILREPTKAEVAAAARFLGLERVEVQDLEHFVRVCEPGASLRTRRGHNVIIGSHMPPPGGPQILADLIDLLTRANDANDSAYAIHCDYEILHPFLDCNGRSGRMLWAWCMWKHSCLWSPTDRGFLHEWYYQSLNHCRK
jgi:hypothetical protein